MKRRDPEEDKFRAVMRKLKLPILKGPIDEVTKLLITVERGRPLKKAR